MLIDFLLGGNKFEATDDCRAAAEHAVSVGRAAVVQERALHHRAGIGARNYVAGRNKDNKTDPEHPA